MRQYHPRSRGCQRGAPNTTPITTLHILFCVEDFFVVIQSGLLVIDLAAVHHTVGARGGEGLEAALRRPEDDH